MQERRFELQPPTAEEVFEDIGLQDEPIKQVKRRGFFSRFGDDGDHTVNSNSSSIFHMGRKRGHSSGGQELGNIAPPDGSNECTENN